MSHTLSGKYATPLSLELHGARQLGVFIAMTHGTALLLLPLTGLYPPLLLAIALVVAASFRHAWRTHVSMASPAAVRRLRWGEGNDWQLVRRDGATRHTCLRPRVLIHPQLVILRFRKSPWQTDCVVLTRDRLDPALFRKLRVRLLTEVNQLSSPAQS